MRHPLRLRAVLLIGLLALGACGGEAGTSDTGDPPAPPPSTTAMATFTGVVVDSAGQPVDGALVAPRSLDTPPRPVPEMAVMSGPDGRYEWRLAAGRYEFSASKDGRTGTPSEVTAAAGATEQVRLHLP
ncbi:carboxypeptidase-like regulatory domain-containing protein [Saccharothrix hoggarensis]|uniref:Carboxypeptidase-like regulatory domain-containing protein n=1 Tax=Saccharothrix hoggarensis TaxID=913853 RepID=A0ABW3QS95_9PSEU